MRKRYTATSALLLMHGALWAEGKLTLPNVTVGHNLQAPATVLLDNNAPDSGPVLKVKVTSQDPARVLFSDNATGEGKPSITVEVRNSQRHSVEFYVHGLASNGTVGYTAKADGFAEVSGKVTLAPAGLVFTRAGMGVQMLRTTTGMHMEFVLATALLDEQMNYVAPQMLAGGKALTLTIASSDAKVGGAADPKLTIDPGAFGATTQFRPAGPGNVTLAVNPPSGFSKPAQFGELQAMVIQPGIAVSDQLTVGQNLQLEGTVSLGEAASDAGVDVTLVSADPAKLLLSNKIDQVGTGKITVHVPAHGVTAPYYIQGLGNSGTVDVTATAKGYRERVGTIQLAFSGVVIGGPPGAPDEAELFRKEAAEGPHGFQASMSSKDPIPVLIYSVQLDPATLRSADLTVQPLRAGMSMTAKIINSNPKVGKVHAETLTIGPGQHTALTQFTPLMEGSTVVSVETPKGFRMSANATEMTVVVAK